MPTTVVQRPAGPTPKLKAVLVAEDGVRVTLPYAPNDPRLSGYGFAWSEIPRSQGKPLLVRGGYNLRRLTYTITLASPDLALDVERVIAGLQRVADSGARCRMTGMGPQEMGLYRVTSMEVTGELRTTRNRLRRATVLLELTEASDTTLTIGRARGPAVSSDPASASRGTPGASSYGLPEVFDPTGVDGTTRVT